MAPTLMKNSFAKQITLHGTTLALFANLLAGVTTGQSEPANAAKLQQDFELQPDDARIMVRWWWFGPAVTSPQLEREMKTMKEGGLGGVEVQPTYPLALDNQPPGLKNLKWMSPEFLDKLRFTAAKARELGLRMDLTLGSGWPYGGPMFSTNEAAGALRAQSVRITAGQTAVAVPPLRPGQQVIAAAIGPMPNTPAGGNPYKTLEIRDGTAQLPADLGGQTQVWFYIGGQTGMRVKRAAYGAEGFVIDHYSPAVVGKFIKEIAEPEVNACGPNPPRAIFCDSLEVGGEDWTPNFLAEFQKRRSYDLKPYLSALYDDSMPMALEIRHDWGQTLTELFNDYFGAGFTQFAKAHNTRFRAQYYGTPPAALYSYAFADLGEGEGFIWKNFRETRLASSANHLLGRPVTSSETWTWLGSAVYRARPLDMKAEADLHFLSGVNQLIGHGWPYTAPGIEYPGWRFYAAAVFNEKNPWWIVMPDVTKYMQRVSQMLREGQPANDVLLYLANSDAWANFVPGRVAMNAAVSANLGREIIGQILESGHNLDFFDDQLLEMRGTVRGDALCFGDLKYKVVVLPGVQRIPVATMKKLEAFAKAGGIVIATRSIPSLAPGFKATAADRQTVKQIAGRLFTGPNALGTFIQDESQFGATLAKRLAPDVRFEPAAPDIGFVHRHTSSAEIYFVANTGNTPKSVNATFRVEGMQPECWNPLTGKIGSVRGVEVPGSTTIALDLAPYGSTFLVFSKHGQPANRVQSVVLWNDHPVAPMVSLPPALDLSSDWSVTFTRKADGQTTGPLNDENVDLVAGPSRDALFFGRRHL